jgi:hypothetical protein
LLKLIPNIAVTTPVTLNPLVTAIVLLSSLRTIVIYPSLEHPLVIVIFITSLTPDTPSVVVLPRPDTSVPDKSKIFIAS